MDCVPIIGGKSFRQCVQLFPPYLQTPRQLPAPRKCTAGSTGSRGMKGKSFTECYETWYEYYHFEQLCAGIVGGCFPYLTFRRHVRRDEWFRLAAVRQFRLLFGRWKLFRMFTEESGHLKLCSTLTCCFEIQFGVVWMEHGRDRKELILLCVIQTAVDTLSWKSALSSLLKEAKQIG